MQHLLKKFLPLAKGDQEGFCTLILLPSLQRSRQGNVVGVLQLRAEGQAAGEAGDSNAEGGDNAAEVHGGLLAFHVGIGRQDDLFDRVVLEPGQ